MLLNSQYIRIFVLCCALPLVGSTAHAADALRVAPPGAHTCSVWEGSLSPEQHQAAEDILGEVQPRLDSLRWEMRTTMEQLEALNYNNETEPGTLARLGQQLQEQRNALIQELHKLNTRLQQEVGDNVRMRGYFGRGCAALEQAPPCPLPISSMHKIK